MKKISLLPLLIAVASLQLGVSLGFAQTFTNGDWTYTLNDSNEAIITAYNGAAGSVEIPPTLGGYAVKVVGNGSPIFGYGNNSVTSVTIPDSVTSVGSFAFYGSINLGSITVDAQNIAYSSLDGVLFNKNQTTLIQWPQGKGGNYAIPSSVTIIGQAAFYSCTRLNSATIPNSVTSIGQYAFAYCISLTSMTIPSSVTSIGYYAFAGCSGLTSLPFMGAPPSYLPDLGDLRSDATIYYLPQYASSWPSTFGGLATSLFAPKVDYIVSTASSGFRFRWTGSADIPMDIQRTTSLTGSAWSNVAVGITNREFNDPNPPAGVAFYRAVLP